MTLNSDYNIEPVKALHQTVAIVGRPNVGKSALFNQIIGRKMAIVHHQSGVTRDRVASMAGYSDCRFMLIDTGGLGLFNDQKKGETAWDLLIREQLHVALESADKVIFVVDVSEDLQALDEEVARLLHSSGKQVFLAANKADNPKLADSIDRFDGLGFEKIQAISCVQNSGIRQLLEEVCHDMPPCDKNNEANRLKIAVVGRPNVGKSSIINRLLGEERVIVSDVAGTTRDAIDIPFVIRQEEREIESLLIDTAGLKRKNKIDTAVDFFSMARTAHAIKQADVIVFVMDAQTPSTAMDRKIGRMVADAGRPCLIIMNKWDLTEDVRQVELFDQMNYDMPFMSYAETMTACAISGYHFKEIIPRILDLAEQVEVEYPTSLINRVVQDSLMRLPPPRSKGRQLKIYYATCVKRRPPTFVLFVNDKSICQGNYHSYLKNQFIQAFGVYGMPMVIELKNRSRDETRKALFDENKSATPKKKNTAHQARDPKGRPSPKKGTKAKPAPKGAKGKPAPKGAKGTPKGKPNAKAKARRGTSKKRK